MALAVSVTWLSPRETLPPHRVTHPEKVLALAAAFRDAGWDATKPVLVGYPYGGRTQLLSGTHRRSAACLADIKIPVIVVPREQVLEAYGDVEYWGRLMRLGGVDG